MPKGGGGLSCNLCWSELQAPFIVTSCGHAFCEKHKTDASLQASRRAFGESLKQPLSA